MLVLSWHGPSLPSDKVREREGAIGPQYDINTITGTAQYSINKITSGLTPIKIRQIIALWGIYILTVNISHNTGTFPTLEYDGRLVIRIIC